jgi:hypothetical protein
MLERWEKCIGKEIGKLFIKAERIHSSLMLKFISASGQQITFKRQLTTLSHKRHQSVSSLYNVIAMAEMDLKGD